MRRIVYLVICLVVVTTISAQSPKRIVKKIGDNPVFFIDSINVDISELDKYENKDFAQVTVYKEKEAKELLGEDGKDGAVYFFTTKYARSKYWSFFRSKSEEYKKMVPTPQSDSIVQYILNEKVLTENFEGNLFLVDDSVFKSIRFLDKETLQSEFKVMDKKMGFQIISDVPDGLYKGKKKF